MYNADFAIDMIQNAKKTWVNSFVQQEGLKAALNKFIDIQSTVTKDSVKALTEANAAVIAEAWNTFKEYDVLKMDQFFTKEKKK